MNAAIERQRLVRLDAAGWAAVALQLSADPAAGACAACWAERDLPLVICRQRSNTDPDRLDLGLPAPLRWQRRRLQLQIARVNIRELVDFPLLETLEGGLRSPSRAASRQLAAALAALSIAARVYGSYGWQQLSGLDYLQADSDLDLLLPINDAELADRAVAVLVNSPPALPRLDGELVFADGSAVAWREWAAWRAGSQRSLLVKRLHEVVLVDQFEPLPAIACAGARP